jgi:hypothetical protein
MRIRSQFPSIHPSISSSPPHHNMRENIPHDPVDGRDGRMLMD